MIVHYQGREVSPLVSILESSTSWTPKGPKTFASNNRSQLEALHSTEAILSFLIIMMGKFVRSTVLRMRMGHSTEFAQV